MNLEINKESFLEEFVKVRNIANRKAKERTPGFTYLHNATVKTLAENGEFKVGNIDFSKFTYDDLEEYIQYYADVLEPKVKLASSLFTTLRSASSIFSPSKTYY